MVLIEINELFHQKIGAPVAYLMVILKKFIRAICIFAVVKSRPFRITRNPEIAQTTRDLALTDSAKTDRYQT